MFYLSRGKKMFEGSTPISRIKRSLPELAGYLYRALDFPDGSFLMTGTCLVPSNDFTLAEKDRVEISIDNIGTLINTVALNNFKQRSINSSSIQHKNLKSLIMQKIIFSSLLSVMV
jgi:fumarylacetoacetate (FAA) hydrolase family protein